MFLTKFLRKCSTAVAKELIFESLKGPHLGIAVLTLNRPKQRNAFSASLIKDLEGALQKLPEKSRVLIIKSAIPGVFCAGADLKERLAMPQELVGKFVANLRGLMDKIQNVPIPVIAALDGLALGGGLEMALACDFRVASTDSKMGLVEGKLAIIPGAGGSQRLPRLIGASLAKELIYTARVVDGAEAKSLGLVNHLVNQNKTGDAAFLKSLEVAKEILPNGPLSVRMAKKAIDEGVNMDLKSALKVEEECYGRLIPTKDRVEGLEAFKDKRKAKFIGQ